MVNFLSAVFCDGIHGQSERSKAGGNQMVTSLQSDGKRYEFELSKLPARVPLFDYGEERLLWKLGIEET